MTRTSVGGWRLKAPLERFQGVLGFTFCRFREGDFNARRAGRHVMTDSEVTLACTPHALVEHQYTGAEDSITLRKCNVFTWWDVKFSFTVTNS